MTLATEYTASILPAFRQKVTMALMHAAVPIAQAGLNTTDEDRRSMRFAIRVLLEPEREAIWVARALAQAGVSDASTDTVIQNAVTNSWVAMAWTRDRTQGI